MPDQAHKYMVRCKELTSDPMPLSDALDLKEHWDATAACGLKHEVVPCRKRRK